MADDTTQLQPFASRSLSLPSQPQANALGRPKNNREKQIDTDFSLSQRYLRTIDNLQIETARAIERMALVTSFAYADATSRMQAIADSQLHPTVQQRAEAFNTQTIDPILQRALGATFLAAAERAHGTLMQQTLPPPEEKKPTWWDKFKEW